MLRNSLIVLVHCFVVIKAIAPECTTLTDNQVKLIGGTKAVDGDAPFQISLFKQGESISNTSFECGGSLLNARTVLTVGICCEGVNASRLIIKYSGTNRTQLTNTVQVKEVILHPDYNETTLDNDFCVLKLDSDVNTSDNVAFISIANSSAASGAVAQLTGWGLSSTHLSTITNLPMEMLKTNLSIVSSVECKSNWSNVKNVTKSMICASSKTSSGCNGDTGGPLTINGQLVGIMSFMWIGCASDSTDHPVVFSDPAERSTRAWIMSKV